MCLPRLGLGGPNYSPSVWLEAGKEIDGSRYNGDGPWVVLLWGRKRRLEWRCELAVRLHFPSFLWISASLFFSHFTPTILLLFHSVPSLSALRHYTHTITHAHIKKKPYTCTYTCTYACTHWTHTSLFAPSVTLSLRPPLLDPYTYVLQMVSFYKR